MSALQTATQALHQAIADEPDPQHKKMLSQALNLCLQCQAMQHQTHSNAKQAVYQALGG